MLTHWKGAGTRTIKLRGGMGLLGVIGKYGAYRFSNTLALVDHHVRGVDRKDAKAGRNWSNYTWHGDQAPGFPFVHGLQASDVDMNEIRFSKLMVSIDIWGLPSFGTKRMEGMLRMLNIDASSCSFSVSTL